MNASTLAQINDEDLDLIIQLLQQDGEEVLSAAIGKGKQPEGIVTDAQAAFNLFIEELHELDGDELLQSQNEEQIAENDHNLSISLSKGESNLLIVQNTLQASAHDDELMEKMACIYITGIDDTESDDDTTVVNQPESSTWAASRQARRTRQRRPCEACGEQMHFAELSRAPCQHEYCRQCLSRLFRDAIIDESLFPPRCCKQSIPLDKSQLFLDANVISQFRQKSLELSTPNRTYCHNTSCAAFIPPANCSHTTATCGECRRQTCTTCKGVWHNGDCPHDEQLQQVIQLAREQGWQRNNIVERSLPSSIVAGAGFNSVTYVAPVGSLVNALIGRNTVYMSVLLRLMLAARPTETGKLSHLDQTWQSERNDNEKSRNNRNTTGSSGSGRSYKTCATTTNAIMKAGSAGEARKNAKNAMM
ncbi:hypothetical protein GQX73_g5854 [Xylaria multiplex]|uniref:IBR domain-containing protein n=1 Tax=Xylaria multiplex TaxID=323545 RepID=A0A7C8MQ44_9PEZI|nr:hypothetical protein GQX73_g5854 [Xylaria multiplex]